MSAQKKIIRNLYRSRTDRYIGGIAGGLGDYFRVDSNIFRILFIIFSFTGGIGIILYIAAYFLIPENPEESEYSGKKRSQDSTFLIALILIIIGSLLLMKEFGVFNYFYWWELPWGSIWAIFLIVLGIFIIFAGRNNPKSEEIKESIPLISGLNNIYRSKNNRMIAGVCGGIGEYFNIDPSIVRLIWILASFASVGIGIVVYLILVFVFPENPDQEEK